MGSNTKKVRRTVGEKVLIGSGKVRNIYQVAGFPGLLFETSNRLSVFDRVVCEDVPGKGACLNCISQENKQLLEKAGVKTDYASMPFDAKYISLEHKGRYAYSKTLTMIPLEIVVRAYLTGSAYKAYKRGETYCGFEFPDGMNDGDKLAYSIITPTTKEKEGHDRPVTRSEAIDVLTNWVTENCFDDENKDAKTVATDLLNQIYSETEKIFKILSDYYEKRNILIIDTKFEFGIDEYQTLMLADEVGTPDSSRLAPKDIYDKEGKIVSLDKQIVRDYCSSRGFTGDEGQVVPEIPEKILKKITQNYLNIVLDLYGAKVANHYL
jgi:phosphoribosylaminoimidazole-succinocarboxamide synthase